MKHYENIKQKRELLKELSKNVKELVRQEYYSTVNEAIIEEIYKKNGHQEFKKFWEWKAIGKNIKKGEKAFIIWAKPKEIISSISDDEKYDYFPICHLFSNLQVE